MTLTFFFAKHQITTDCEEQRNAYDSKQRDDSVDAAFAGVDGMCRYHPQACKYLYQVKTDVSLFIFCLNVVHGFTVAPNFPFQP